MAGFVQQVGIAGNFSTISSFVVTITHNTTKGNTIIGIVKTGSGAAVTSVSDTQSNTWTVDKQSALSGATAAVIRGYLKTALTTSDTVTVNFGSNNSNSVILCEYTGHYATIDKSAVKNSGAATSNTLAIGSSLQSSTDLVIFGVSTGGNVNQTSISLSSSTPSATVRSQGPASFNDIAQADGLASATTAPTASWSWTSSQSSALIDIAYGLQSPNQAFFNARL